MSAAGNPLIAGAMGNNKVTTDHNGKLIHVRGGGVPMSQPVSTTVTVSKGSSPQKGQKGKGGVNFYRGDQSSVHTSQLFKDPSISMINKDTGSGFNRQNTKLLLDKKRTSEFDDGDNQRVNRAAEEILGNTASSHFGHKKADKNFSNIQTVEYSRSIQITQMADGVSIGGRNSNYVRPLPSQRMSQHAFDPLSAGNSSMLHNMQSQHI